MTAQLIEIYKKHKCSVVAIEEIPFSEIENYGVISGDLIDGTNDTYKVTSMIEKPNPHDLIDFEQDRVDLNKVPTFMAIIGRYILTPDIFNILRDMKSDNGSEIQITDALQVLAKQGKVIAYKFNGNRFDCGSVSGYVKAINYFAEAEGLI